MRSLLRPHHEQELTLDDPRFARYAEYTGALFNAIADLSGADVIVDSSKSPARALALSRTPGLDVRMLHLVRDVRGVAYSLRKLSAPKPGEDLLGVARIPYATGADYLKTQGHQVAGNEGRMRPVQAIATDETWRQKFGFGMQKGLYLLVLPLMLHYRYRL